MVFEEFEGKYVRVFLKSKRISFSGRLLAIDGNFLKLDDRYVGLKIVAIDAIENVQEWKR
ncbi:MAG: hypothetical protein ABH824_04310 [Nanoarchaeota archaeon]